MNILELAILKKMVGGGGGSGTDNYNDLLNLPQINGETLAGNKTAENLGLQDALTFDSAPTEDSTNPVESGGVYNALAGKQDNLTFDGVYNASTNKAATESTVTNAIAGLDVSAFSVDADETISSISETDGKINVTKQDIAIASNQVTAMTGYTKPSSAPATPAIQTSDTANQAFGKLEFKADTNQTNILLVKDATEELVDNGAKNVLNGNWKSTGIFTVNPDKSITINGTTGEAGATLEILGNGGGYIPNNYGGYALSGCIDGSTSSYSLCATYSLNGSTWAAEEYQTTEDRPLIIRNDYAYIRIIVLVRKNQTMTNKTVYPMLCEKPFYDVSQTYTLPGALPNYDLTQLEAEDRAALIECVDKGAKNKFDFNNSTIVREQYTTTTKSSDNLVVACTGAVWAFTSLAVGKFTGNNTFTFKISELSNSGASPYVRFTKNQDGSNPILDIAVAANGTYTANFEGDGSDYYICIYLNPSATSQTVSLKMSDIMICDTSEYNVSPTVTPYALQNTDLTQLQAEDRAGLIECIDEGAKNIAKENDFTFQEPAQGSGGNMYKFVELGDYTAGTYVISFQTISSTDTDAFTCKIGFDNAAHSTLASGYISRGNNVSIEIDIPNDAKYLWLIASDTIAHSYDDTITVTGLMICTLADWKVSKTYQPYRPDYDLLITKSDVFGIGTEIVGTAEQHEDLDNYKTIGKYYTTSGTNTSYVDHIPTGAGSASFILTVENMNNDTSFIQTYMKVTDPTCRYERRFPDFSAGTQTWTPWYKFTGQEVT